MVAGSTPIGTDIDFEREGKQIACLRLMHSDNRHAYSEIPIPVAVIARGSGPTVLLCAGNHGDEYEGQVILGDLIRATEPEMIQGRLIVLPALNYPAVRAGARVSPLDGGNLNRSFPGRGGGPPTDAIAHYITGCVLPLCDAGVDLHSGGSTGRYLPLTFLCTHSDPDFNRRLLALADAFGAPLTLAVDGASAPTGLDPVAHSLGVAFISTELGGGANVGLEALRVGRAGVARVLSFLGVMDAAADLPPPAAARYCRSSAPDEFVSSPVSGLFEPCRSLGETVAPADTAGRVHCVDDPARAPTELCFRTGGLIVSERVNGRVERGDYVFQAVPEVSRDDLLGAR